MPVKNFNYSGAAKLFCKLTPTKPFTIYAIAGTARGNEDLHDAGMAVLAGVKKCGHFTMVNCLYFCFVCQQVAYNLGMAETSRFDDSCLLQRAEGLHVGVARKACDHAIQVVVHARVHQASVTREFVGGVNPDCTSLHHALDVIDPAFLSRQKQGLVARVHRRAQKTELHGSLRVLLDQGDHFLVWLLLTVDACN